MNQTEINRLISHGKFPEPSEETKLVETHISWVILCDQYVYKIKKPINYSFLDFSTLDLRKHFCQRELELNRRFTENIYLEVLPIYEANDGFQIGGKGAELPECQGNIVEYTLKMRKLDPDKQMDVLVLKKKVSPFEINDLARRIAEFHKTANILFEKNVLSVQEKFNDLGDEMEFLRKNIDADSARTIEQAIKISDAFLNKNESLLYDRLKRGFFRDVHGDLHTRNIFLLPEPQLFDCIEFNDDYRQIDILNEVAFLCMDLDALGREDLSQAFIKQYNFLLPVIQNESEQELFVYYKSYRANVRAKVNSLRAKSASNEIEKLRALAEVQKYMNLMCHYFKMFPTE
jgi:aminoglycoside phosphotransferase family enzyme